MSIAVQEEGEKREASIAEMIKAQYTLYDPRNVMGHTEIPKRQIPAVVTMMTLHEVIDILSAPKPNRADYGFISDEELEEGEEPAELGDEQQWLAEAYAKALDKWKLRQHIENDDVAMLNLIAGSWMFSYGLAMRSVDRKIRLEGVKIGSASMMAKSEADNIGVSSKVLNALGLGRFSKHKKVYVNKE